MEVSQRYEILYEIAGELNSSLAPQEVLHTIVETICQAADARGCSLMLLTQDRQQLVHTIACGLSDRYVQKGPVREDGVLAQVLEGRPVTIFDAATDPRVQY